ncbi:MAG: spermidine synthase [Bacillota bacterium]
MCNDVVEAAGKHFSRENGHILGSGNRPVKGRLIFQDGRNYVAVTGETYDIIVSDSTHPGSFDSWALYTRDFYRQCSAKLREGGVMVQWLPLHARSVWILRRRDIQRFIPG